MEADDDVYFDAFDWDYNDSDCDYLDDIDISLLPNDALPTGPPPPLVPPPSTATSFYRGYTDALRRDIPTEGPTVASRAEAVLHYMRDNQGLNLELFLESVFWGDAGCIANPKCIHERSVFMKSPTLISVLDHWWHHASGDALRGWTVGRAAEVLGEEMDQVGETSFKKPDNPLSKEYLTHVDFRAFGMQLQSSGAPYLWYILQMLASTPRQRKENTVKNPFHVRVIPENHVLNIVFK